MKPFEHVVAQAVRVEKDLTSGKLYLVFEIVDEQFKKRIENDWSKDVEVKLVGKELCLK
mgnify:CR=1 FL=1